MNPLPQVELQRQERDEWQRVSPKNATGTATLKKVVGNFRSGKKTEKREEEKVYEKKTENGGRLLGDMNGSLTEFAKEKTQKKNLRSH